MIIKTFSGESAAAALKQVRAELGGNAVVLTTRRVPDANGGYVTEVTACLDGPAPNSMSGSSPRIAGTNRKVTAPVWNRVPQRPTTVTTPISTGTDLSSIDAKLEKLLSRADTNESPSKIVAQLRDLDLPNELTATITSQTGDQLQLAEKLRLQVTSRLSGYPQFQAGDRVLVVGPAGSGKTTVVSKLAAQLVTRNQRVTITGLNQQKIGAIDELQSIADLIGVACPSDTESNVIMTSDAITLIDCGSLTLSTNGLSSLNPTHTIFVFPATSRTADLQTIAASLSGLPVTHLAMTMLDQTHRLGALFALCDLFGAPLSLVSNSPFGAASLSAPVDSILVAHMFAKGDQHGR
jgi:flagellar biosynthesis protein FlhF